MLLLFKDLKSFLRFLPLTLTLSHKGRGDLFNIPSLDGRG